MPAKSTKKPIRTVPPLMIGICAAVIVTVLGLFGGVFIPKYQAIKTLDAQIISQKSRLNLQKNLKLLDNAAQKFSGDTFRTDLPEPRRKTFDRRKIYELTGTLKQLAIRNRMVLTQSQMDLRSGEEGADHILLSLSMTGRLNDFRTCLIDLISLEYFRQFEKITIFSGTGDEKKYSTTLRIDISKG